MKDTAFTGTEVESGRSSAEMAAVQIWDNMQRDGCAKQGPSMRNREPQLQMLRGTRYARLPPLLLSSAISLVRVSPHSRLVTCVSGFDNAVGVRLDYFVFRRRKTVFTISNMPLSGTKKGLRLE
jgi:hypothetical protein